RQVTREHEIPHATLRYHSPERAIVSDPAAPGLSTRLLFYPDPAPDDERHGTSQRGLSAIQPGTGGQLASVYWPRDNEARDNEKGRAMIHTGGLTHIHFAVRDLDRSLRFYQQAFGMQELSREGELIFLQTPAGDDCITLHGDPHHELEPGKSGGIA